MRVVIGKNRINTIEVGCLITSFISIIVCLFFGKGVYQYVGFLPLTFFSCYLLILFSEVRKSFTVKIISLCAFLRYVVLSVFQSICPVYTFSRYTTQNVDLIFKAIALMCYELVFVSIFIKFYFSIKHSNGFEKPVSMQVEQRFTSGRNKYGLIFIFSMCAILYSMINPDLMSQISFLVIKSNTSVRMGQNAAGSSSGDMILRQVFVTAVLSMFVIVITLLRTRIYKKHPKLSFHCSLLLAVLCTCMIVSEQRSSQVYCAFAAVILLIQLYPEKKRRIITIIGAAAGVVLVMLSIYKTFFAFMYSTYADALINSNMGLESVVQNLEIYLLGPVTVASAIQFASVGAFNFSLSQLLFDFGRSTIGVSFFFKGSDKILTSEAYNQFITGGGANSGYLLPITGQGYEFLGFIFSPVLICLFFYLAFKIEKIMFKSNSTYIIFFVAYIYIRVATCMVSSNLNSVLVALSTVMVSAGVIFLLQYFLTIIKKRR
ncbi:hypothetical protein SAMN04515624_105179 [Eubacterium maltosivorans]|uniref:hypothetical protein n=1 Tax=Eubacterium maltosivorans TaxID=2041044 RepID=UPI00088360DE|nr:hypothetical protein [Eubacterium maltosivorans]WPK79741.1 hypothetical protein EUMA32_11500 [Eubacterium maltosivorans]SDP03273.1 hypothetical protein SAMN04515624_105179 [Eubacterium maltosivorans]